MMMRGRKVAVIGAFISGFWMPTVLNAAVVLLDDQFLDGSRANGANPGETDTDWWAQNNSSGGSSWSIGTDNTSPLSGSVLQNSSGSAVWTTMYGSFASVTLGVGDSITFAMDVRRYFINSTFNSEALVIKLGYDGGTPFTQDYMAWPVTAPIADDTMISTANLTNSVWFADTDPDHLVFQLTLRGDGSYARLVTIDGVTAVSDTLAASVNPTHQFDQVSLWWPRQTEVDNISVTVTVIPEPSAIALFAGAGLLLWRYRRKTRLGTPC
jgi:hypothetical protein